MGGDAPSAGSGQALRQAQVLPPAYMALDAAWDPTMLPLSFGGSPTRPRLRYKHGVVLTLLGMMETPRQRRGVDQEVIDEELPADVDGNRLWRRFQVGHADRPAPTIAIVT